jgi:hypothetical protein
LALPRWPAAAVDRLLGDRPARLLANRYARTRPVRSFDPEAIAGIMQSSRRNCWVPWDAIARAELGSSRLTLDLQDGHRVVLMWVPVDDVSPLRNTLPVLLGERFYQR